MHNGIANTAIISVFALVLLLLRPPFHSSYSSSRSHSSQPGPGRFGAADALREQPSTSNLVIATMKADRVLTAADPHIRKHAAGLEAKGLYILCSVAQLKDRGVSLKANCINSELEARMIEYVAGKIYRDLKMTKKAVIAHLSSPNGKYTRLRGYIEKHIRGTKGPTASDKATANLNDGVGPFQGYDCSDDLTKEVRDDMIAQIEGMARDGKVEGMSRKQAEAATVRILEQHGLEYVHFLTLPELRALVDRHVRYEKHEEYPSRPNEWWKIGTDSSSASEPDSSSAASSSGSSVGNSPSGCSASALDVDENDCGSSASGPSSHGPLHQTVRSEVLNETVAMTDTLVHMKATINQSIAMLEKGEAITLDLFDESFGENNADDSDSEELPGKFMEDIYVMAPEKFEHQMCQGQAWKYFDDYKAFDDHWKTLERGRYLVGLFHARVFDCNSKFSMPSGGGGGGDGIPITPNQNAKSQIFRELAYTPSAGIPGTLRVSPDDPTRKGKLHTFFLHRFVALVANEHGINIFGEGVLSNLGIEFEEGKTYCQHFAYRPITKKMEAKVIARALRVGDAHSRQCDVDHRRGRDKRWLHGILFAHPTSHRMNTCLSHCRINAGHWCFGLEIYPYKGGVESTERTGTALPKDLVFPRWKQVLKEGNTFDGAKQLRKLDIVPVPPLQDLVPIKPEDVDLDNVDCTCSSLKKGQTKCRVCRMNEQENEKQSKKKQSAKKRKSDASSAAPGEPVKTRSGRVSKRPVP